MNGRTLDIAFWNYDRTRALSDGRVRIEGVEARFHTARIVPQIFEAMIRQRAYDVSELGMTYVLRTFAQDPSPFLAIPVLPNRCFRHSAIYVSTASGIAGPEDLVDRTIGELALYGHDAGVMPKGIPDLIARLFARQPSDRLKTPVVVENKGGANGQIATQALANVSPDGCFWLRPRPR
jgi:4,5-dihydroxyphthalate decarboxylase